MSLRGQCADHFSFTSDRLSVVQSSNHTIGTIEELGKLIATGKVRLLKDEDREKLIFAEKYLYKDLFFENPTKGVKRNFGNTIFAHKEANGIFFTERRPIGITSEKSVDIVPNAHQPQEFDPKSSKIYTLLDNKFVHVYPIGPKPSQTRIDMYEKIPFIDQMACTESALFPADYSIFDITPEGIALIKSLKLSQIFFKHLSEQSMHFLLAPFSKILSHLNPENKSIVMRAASFTQKNALVAILLKIDTLCTILVGYRTGKNTPILQINPPKECHTCSWDADETGLITNAYYYNYPFALGLLSAVKKQPLFEGAEQIIFHGLPKEIIEEGGALKKSEIIINTGT